MSDFVSEFWEFYVGILTVVSILACGLLLASQNKRRPKGEKVDTTGHVWDEDLREWNNPLPNWWRWLFYITIVFSLAYLVFFPGLGMWGGTLQWTAVKEYETEQTKAGETYGPLFAKYAQLPVEKVAADPAALAIGQNLFLNYCAGCHASDARGSKGFPNLADKDWLYGDAPATIHATIADGRNGMMPPFGAALGGEGVRDVAHYVLALSDHPYDSLRAARGRERFAQNCAACHGAEGKGNVQIGAPNLTDATWLHGGSETAITETIARGRSNAMPEWKSFLDEAKIHVLAAYVWSLSHEAPKDDALLKDETLKVRGR